MTPERWQKIKELCDVLLDCEPEGREKRLSELCRGDDELKREIQSFLAEMSAGNGVLDAPVWRNLGIGGAEPAGWMPAVIGRYRVLRLVGAGGMGAVYEAEQDQPRRTIALKVIKPGFSNTELLRRFEREAQALARLQHPGIAQIYEAGTADSEFGRQPYFAMEFVRGETLKAYAAGQRLQTRQRLDLVARVCDAIEHAHQRGLIHRDLKPGNILVDAAGQPKILDFGLARLTDSDIHATKHTDVGLLLGTLAYMSPEQVLADPLELDTRSDVYALGVILYELLAERLPYPISNRLHEAMQTIRDEDPVRLSLISRAYRGDIEIIVAKALEKDKLQRYPSAAALADDIRRYLNDQPISARPPSTSYQLQKFARRHKGLVGGAAAVFVVLVGGIVTSMSQALRAREAERKAQQERNQALAEKLRADTESRISQEVSAFLQRDLLAQASAKAQSRPDNRPDPDLKVRTVLDRAAARINDRFHDQPLVEGSIRQTIGTAYQGLGLLAEARQHLQRAFDLRATTLGENDALALETLAGLAYSHVLEGQYPQAEELYVRAVEGLRRAHGSEHPDVLAAESDLSLVYQHAGKYSEAETLLRNVLSVQRRVLGLEHQDTASNTANLARLYMNQGKYPLAEPLYREALALNVKLLGPEHPQTLSSMSGLAMTLNALGKRAEAESIFRDVLEKDRRVHGAEHPDTLIAMNNLGLLYMGQGRFREAEPLYAESLATKRRVIGDDHPDTLTTMNNLGALYSDQSRFAEAEPLLTKVMHSRRRILGPEHPNTFNAMTNVAQLYYRQGRIEESEALLTQTLAGRERVLGKEHPSTWVTLNHLAVVHSLQGRLKEAESILLPLLENWRRDFGDNLETFRTIDNLGTVYFLQRDFTQAQTFYTKALEGRRGALGENSPDVLRTASSLAAVTGSLGRTEEALSMLNATLKVQRQVLGDEHLDTQATIERLGNLCGATGLSR